MKKNLLLFFSILFITFSLGFLSSFLGGDASQFYGEIIRPNFAPPAFLFGIVWPILYILLSISAFIMIKKARSKKVAKRNFLSYVILLILLFIWPILFFRFENLLFAFLEIIVVLFFSIFLIFLFKKESKTASYLMIPYLFWISFAFVLNYSVLLLN